VLEAREAAPSKCKVLDAENENGILEISYSVTNLEVVQCTNLVVISFNKL
jgi:hypothetical protein